MKYMNKSTYICKLFLTLRNVHKMSNDLTITQVLERITLNASNKIHIIVVREDHKSCEDYHYHIIVLEGSFRKNTYHKDIRALFPEFTGKTLDVQGIKSITKTVSYLIKTVDPKELFRWVNSRGSDYFVSKNKVALSNVHPLKFFKKHPLINSLSLIADILKWDRIRNFLHNRSDHFLKSVKSPKYYQNAWQLSREMIEPQKVLEGFNPSLTELEFNEAVNLIFDKYKVSWEHLVVLTRIIYFILIKEGVFPQPTKSKNLLIIGDPNTGKTSLLTKITEVFKYPNLFYFVGSRANDFSAYPVGDNPIIVFDDVLTYPNLNWSHSTLLKTLGHEPILVDVKYGTPLTIPPSNYIIITNDYSIFSDTKDAALEARVMRVYLREIAHWHRISDEEFLLIFKMVINNLVLSLNFKGLTYFLQYGNLFQWRKSTDSGPWGFWHMYHLFEDVEGNLVPDPVPGTTKIKDEYMGKTKWLEVEKTSKDLHYRQLDIPNPMRDIYTEYCKIKRGEED